MIKNISTKIKQEVIFNKERMARRRLLEELFYDFYRSRGRVYYINFVRGMFFGLGTVLGGTVVVAFLVWLLSRMAFWIPSIADFVKQVIDAIN